MTQLGQVVYMTPKWVNFAHDSNGSTLLQGGGLQA